MIAPLLTAASVAVALGHSVEWFYKNRQSLESRGFPKPIVGCGNRWDPEAILAWRRRQRDAALRDDDAVAAERYADVLDRRAAEIAGHLDSRKPRPRSV